MPYGPSNASFALIQPQLLPLLFSRIKWFTEISYDCRGTEIAEAALVLPLVFMLLLGIIWFGRAFDIYSTLSHAAREGARVAAVPLSAWQNFRNTSPSAQRRWSVQSVVLKPSRPAQC